MIMAAEKKRLIYSDTHMYTRVNSSPTALESLVKGSVGHGGEQGNNNGQGNDEEQGNNEERE